MIALAHCRCCHGNPPSLSLVPSPLARLFARLPTPPTCILPSISPSLPPSSPLPSPPEEKESCRGQPRRNAEQPHPSLLSFTLSCQTPSSPLFSSLLLLSPSPPPGPLLIPRSSLDPLTIRKRKRNVDVNVNTHHPVPSTHHPLPPRGTGRADQRACGMELMAGS